MLVIFAASDAVKAQSEKTARNSVYVELLGNAALYSVNYDRLLSPSVSGRAGVMYISADALTTTSGSKVGGVSVTLVPVMLNYLSGKNHKFELGAGPVFIFASADFDELGSFSGSGVGGTATFGYRYQPKKGGFNFRAGFTPIFGDGGFFPSGGISFGFGF